MDDSLFIQSILPTSNEGVGPPKEEIDRLNEEKETLQQRLKEITQARMKMLQKMEQQQQQQMQHPRMRNRSQSRERIHAPDRRHSIDASAGLKGYPCLRFIWLT